MKKILFLLSVFLFISPNMGRASSFLVVGYKDKPTSAISILRQADYVVMPIMVKSKQKDPIDRFTEMKAAKFAVMKQAEIEKVIRVTPGKIRISPKPISKYRQYEYFRETEEELSIAIIIDNTAKDIYDYAIRLRQFIDKVEAPGKSSYEAGTIELAVENPERYRSEVLKQIQKEIDATRGILGKKGKAILSGLESPVLIRQVENNNVEVSIDYTLSLEQE